MSCRGDAGNKSLLYTHPVRPGPSCGPPRCSTSPKVSSIHWCSLAPPANRVSLLFLRPQSDLMRVDVGLERDGGLPGRFPQPLPVGMFLPALALTPCSFCYQSAAAGPFSGGWLICDFTRQHVLSPYQTDQRHLREGWLQFVCGAAVSVGLHSASLDLWPNFCFLS